MLADRTQLPAFALRLLAATDEDRATALSSMHPEHKDNCLSWQVLLDAFEGRGGFLDGTYLWPYPREEQPDFAKRQKMARYHNYLETLVDLYVRFMFTQGVRRDSKSTAYNEWLQDVDGAGTTVDEFLKRYAAMALVAGHAGMLVDKTQEEPTGPTRADERARVVASIFPAPSILDWRHERSALRAVKLKEAAPERSIDEPIDPAANADQYLLWDVEGWARFDGEGRAIAGATPGIGMVPLVVLRPKPSQLSQMLGRALVSNANVIRALFNRASEEDEVIRAQAFSVLTVSVPPDGDVAAAKAELGNTVGSARALVVKGQIDYKTPDQAVPGTIRDNMSYLVQEVYRAAHMRFQRDSLAAQSGESIRLQYSELNEMLQGFSKSLAQAERDMARAWFAWSAPTPEAAQQEFERAEPQATYPDEFFLDALAGDLEAWAQGIAMNLGETMTRRIKKKAARRIEPDMPQEELKKVDAEIDAQTPEELNPASALQMAGVEAASAGAADAGNLRPEMNGNADEDE